MIDLLGRVALVEKNRPEWQKGRMNGIGGHIEEGEAPWDAMVREFWEETGCRTEQLRWKNFVTLSGEDFKSLLLCLPHKPSPNPFDNNGRKDSYPRYRGAYRF